MSATSKEDSGRVATSSGELMSIFGTLAGVASVLPIEQDDALETLHPDTGEVHWVV